MEGRKGQGKERRGYVGMNIPLLNLHSYMVHPPPRVSASTLSDTEGMRTWRAARRGKAKERIRKGKERKPHWGLWLASPGSPWVGQLSLAAMKEP